MTITYDALDLTEQGTPGHWILQDTVLLVTSGGHHCRPVQTCSLQTPLVLTSGGH